MAIVKMTRDWRGFSAGTIQDLPDGIADAYVNHARAAVYVEKDEAEDKDEKVTRTRRIPGPREDQPK